MQTEEKNGKKNNNSIFSLDQFYLNKFNCIHFDFDNSDDYFDHYDYDHHYFDHFDFNQLNFDHFDSTIF